MGRTFKVGDKVHWTDPCPDEDDCWTGVWIIAAIEGPGYRLRTISKSVATCFAMDSDLRKPLPSDVEV